MRLGKTVALAAVVIAMQAGCHSNSESVRVKLSDRTLDAAVAEARATLPIFWRRLDHDPDLDRPSVKIGFPSAHGGTEYLWVLVESHSTDAVRGEIGNEPEDVPNVHKAQPYVGKTSGIIDWTYAKADKFYGQFTTRELMKQGAFKHVASDLAPTPLEPGDH